MSSAAWPQQLAEINAARTARAGTVPPLDVTLERALDGPSRRLAVYGSLAPGRSNHHHVAGMRGSWFEGWVEGVLHDRGWGAGMGFPGIVLRPGGPRVGVWVLESDALPGQWERLDAFEGPEYIRLLAVVHRDDEPPVVTNVYALRNAGP